MDNIVIDNCVVSRFMGNGVKIAPIRLFQKLNPNFNVNSLQKITYGSRREDNNILSGLCTGNLKFDDLFINSVM